MKGAVIVALHPAGARPNRRFTFISHHFHSSIILDFDSLPLYYFIYYKNLMYTTIFCSGIDPPPTASRRRHPVSFSPPVVKISQARSREAPSSRSRTLSLHTSSPAHKKLPTFTLSSRLTESIPVHGPHLNLPSYPFPDYVQTYLRRPLRYSHRPSHNTNPENQSIDSQTIRSNYSFTLPKSAQLSFQQ